MIIKVNPTQHVDEDGSVAYASDSIILDGLGSTVYTGKDESVAINVKGDVVYVGNLNIHTKGEMPMIIKNFTLQGRYRLTFFHKVKTAYKILKAYWTGSNNIIID